MTQVIRLTKSQALARQAKRKAKEAKNTSRRVGYVVYFGTERHQNTGKIIAGTDHFFFHEKDLVADKAICLQHGEKVLFDVGEYKGKPAALRISSLFS